MTLSRALRKFVGRLLIGVALLAQFAVASYACTSLKSTASMAAGSILEAILVSASDAVAMPPGCDQLDPDATNLCVEHCHQGQQRADTAAAPIVGAGIPTLLYSLPLEPQHSLGSGWFSPAYRARLEAAPEPPHAILHCVFRT